MIKYMTMSEAFKCGNNDSPFIDGEFNSDKDFTKKGLLELSEYDGFKPWPSPKNQLSDQWQVQKAEPKVLTAKEVWDGGHFMHGIFDETISVSTFNRIFKSGDKNGQLREWLRPEQAELRDDFERIINSIRSIRKGRVGDYNVYCDTKFEVNMIDNMYKRFQNLKPLN